jgi:hypothetical protein
MNASLESKRRRGPKRARLSIAGEIRRKLLEAPWGSPELYDAIAAAAAAGMLAEAQEILDGRENAEP